MSIKLSCKKIWSDTSALLTFNVVKKTPFSDGSTRENIYSFNHKFYFPKNETTEEKTFVKTYEYGDEIFECEITQEGMGEGVVKYSSYITNCPSTIAYDATSFTIEYEIRTVKIYPNGSEIVVYTETKTTGITCSPNDSIKEKTINGTFKDTHDNKLSYSVKQLGNLEPQSTSYSLKVTYPKTSTILPYNQANVNVLYNIQTIVTYVDGSTAVTKTETASKNTNIGDNTDGNKRLVSGKVEDKGTSATWSCWQFGGKDDYTISYSVPSSSITPPTVDATATTATLTYTIRETKTYKGGTTETQDLGSQTVTVSFSPNDKSYKVTKTGTYTDGNYGVKINWSVSQRGTGDPTPPVPDAYITIYYSNSEINESNETTVTQSIVTKNDTYNENTVLSAYLKSQVTVIGSSAFYSCVNLSKIDGGSEITNIGINAFRNCSSLTTASFPNCTTIGNSAFDFCTKLTTVSFPKCTYIKQSAFCFCSSLSAASFPSCTSIGFGAFYACGSLTTVSFPKCSYIDAYAFCFCDSLSAASFPSCTSIGSNAFYSCSNLSTISFPNCTSIGTNAFYYCYFLRDNFNVGSLTSTDNWGATLCDEEINGILYNSNQTIAVKGRTYITSASNSLTTSIGETAFWYCSNLTTVSFPNCTYIGSKAFMDCYSLTKVSFNNCTSIDSAAFYDCSNLTTASFPNCSYINIRAFDYCKSLRTVSFPSCTYIGSSAFHSCINLSTLYLNSVTSVTSLPYSNAFDGCSKLTSIYVPASLVESFKAATNWTYFSSKIVGESTPTSVYITIYYNDGSKNESNETTVTQSIVTNKSSKDASGVTEVTLNNGVTKIDKNAFYKCISLKKINIPNSVTSIDNSAFNICSGMTDLTIGTGLTKINYVCFNQCYSLKTIIIPNTVEEIGDSAFNWCTGVTSLTLSNKIKKIGHNSFAHLTLLSGNITLPDTLTDMQYDSFNTCRTLTSVTYPDSLTYVGGFIDCSNLAYFNWPSSVIEILEYAFRACSLSSMKNLVIPDTILEIGAEAFDSSGIESCTLPSNLTVINQKLFSTCLMLTKIVFPNGLLEIKDEAFYRIGENANNNFETLELPSSINKIGENVFDSNKIISIKYKNKEYTSKNELINVLKNNLVTLGSDIFGERCNMGT